MGAYRNDFRENARKILSAIAGDQEIDSTGLTQKLGVSEASVWRAIRAMKEVGLLVREGGRQRRQVDREEVMGRGKTIKKTNMKTDKKTQTKAETTETPLEK